MEETPHSVAHFMAVGAEKRLDDYHFLRNTYETITGQEIQLNRILRLLGEDEFTLNWRTDLLPIGRARSRSLYDSDRWNNALVLKGSIAYERLRELEEDNSKNARQSAVSSPSRRVQELRERRQRFSEQRDYPSPATSGDGSSGTSSSLRLRALAEYDTALAESEAKRQRQIEENRLNTSKNEEKEVPQRKREKFKTTFDDDVNQKYENKSYTKSKQQEDEPSNHLTKNTNLNKDQDENKSYIRSKQQEDEPDNHLNEDHDENVTKDQENNSKKIQKSTIEYDHDKSGNIELISFTVRCQAIPSSNKNENNPLVRLLCQWASPSSSSAINYFTIERQLDDNEWLPIGEKIDKLANQTQLDISSSNDDNNNDEIKATSLSYFRLKAHLQNGQTFTSKPTDGIFINSSQEKNVIIPDVEILSPNSVQLTWTDNETEDKESEVIKNKDNQNEDNIKKGNKNEVNKDKDNQNEDNIKKGSKNEVNQNEDNENEVNENEVNTDKDNQNEDGENEGNKSEVDENEDNENEGNDNEDNENEGNDNEDNRNEEKANIYDIEKKEEEQSEWVKVTEVPLSQRSVRIDSLTDAEHCQFRLIPSSSAAEESAKSEDEVEPEVLTVNNVNEWLNSLHIKPTSPTTVDVDISEEGFQKFDCYTVEYTRADKLDQWEQMSDITRDDPHLEIDNLKQGTDYKFRFTPVSTETTTNETNSSQLSLVLDVKMPSARKGRFAKEESEIPVATPPQFSIQKLDPTSVLIEAVIPAEEPATFEDVFDVYSKNETTDDDWTKVGTIDKEHLSTTVENLEENTAYAFKIDNITSPSADNESNTIQELKFDTTPVKQYDPSLFLEKIEQSLENVVNGVMQAAAGHQTVEEPVNKSLNEVIKEVFRDETLLPNEQYGFDTLALNNDLQIYRGPKQMMLKDLEVDETTDLSKHYGEIIIHNYRTSQQSVIVREENGNTRVGNIDGDIIIRNVVSDVLLKNEQTHHQLSMNIVGQAFLKGVQGTLIASKFKGIIVVKNVNKP